MDTVELLTKFSDPEVIRSLTVSQRLTAGLITTILGMGITFVALVVLQIITGLFEKLTPTRIAAQQVIEEPITEPVSTDQTGQQDEELVAAITVALAMQLQTAASNIVIKNIRKLEDHSPTWNKVGLAEQMNNNS